MIHAASLAAGLALALALPAQADGFRFRTEFGLSGSWSDATSQETALGFGEMTDLNAGLRLMWTGSEGPFRFGFHATINATEGDSVGYAAALAPFLPAPAPQTYLNLTNIAVNDADTLVTNKIDRAWISYSSDHLVVKFGRQAITWGSGMVFHPADIVVPFPPNAIDTSYKPGADMLYLQYLFDNGADIQAIAVPRAAFFGGPVRFDQSTYALRASASAGDFDGSLMFARDRGDSVASLGLSGPLGGASWNAEYVHWWLPSGEEVPSWLLNISNFGTLGDWNISYFAEYFHNGFGVDASVPFDALPASLTKRMSTGQVFYAGEDFLALGAQVQMTPDLSVSPSAVVSLDDGSALGTLGVNYSLGDNTDLSFTYFHPFGADGTEFGGRETSAGSGVYLGPPQAASLRLVHYF